MRRQRRRRRLSMTSLIDVIFLLLLFFMLSSTFTRFAEVDLASAGSGTAASEMAERPVFLSLAADSLRLNGAEASLATLGEALAAQNGGDARLSVLIALTPEVTAQRLTDLLVALRALPDLSVTVLEAT